ncbi:hypothetical protein D910_09000 [Dendroctonus ponderosae]|uniref:BHLH domain-containing protein n=1 Tax=Dendroctonus ponderosae TaxID=77166 RepID=U4UF60_DENPD|nr:hypothetical protein D910_09000 [Dendroctonus ponderosae]
MLAVQRASLWDFLLNATVSFGASSDSVETRMEFHLGKIFAFLPLQRPLTAADDIGKLGRKCFYYQTKQDPMSHRIIEKRRRDRMNNCLADLSRLIPMEYLKKGRGRIEKTEIIEMAIKHMKHLQSQDRSGSSIEHYRVLQI